MIKLFAALAILLLLFGPVGLPVVFMVNLYQKQYWFIANDNADLVHGIDRHGYEVIDHLDKTDKVSMLNVALLVVNSLFCILTLTLLALFAFHKTVPGKLWIGIDCLLVLAGLGITAGLQFFYSSPDTTYKFKTSGAATGKLEEPFTLLLNPMLIVLEGLLAVITLCAVAFMWWPAHSAKTATVSAEPTKDEDGF